MYACDAQWWDYYIKEVKEIFAGELWCYEPEAALKYGLFKVEGTNAPGLGKDGIIHTGQNSGYQAINLAYLLGAKKIILLGFDMQNTNGKSHHHGDHPTPLNRHSNPAAWVKNFIKLAEDLKAEGVEVINATRETALTAFKRADLEVAL